MYRITDEDGNVLAQCDSPRYVRLKEETGAWVQCNAALAQCVAINGIRYSLPNRELVEDAPKVVFINEVDAAAALLSTEKATATNASDIETLSKAMTLMATEIVQMLAYEET